MVIFTDGCITDMYDTIDQICLASRSAMSIIIIGVGNADFTDMERLDCDGQLLQGRQYTAARDIVQFVEFEKFKQSEMLVAEVLREIPGQLEEFYRGTEIYSKIFDNHIAKRLNK